MAYSPQYAGAYASPGTGGRGFASPVAGGAGAGAGAGGMDWVQAQQYHAQQAELYQAAQAQAYSRQYAATPESNGSYYGSPASANGGYGAAQQAHQRALAVAAAAVARGEAPGGLSTPLQPMQVRPGPDGSYGAGARVATPLGFDRTPATSAAPPPPPLIGSPLARGVSDGGEDEAAALRGKLDRANERIAEKDRRLQQALADQDALTSKVRVRVPGVGGGEHAFGWLGGRVCRRAGVQRRLVCSCAIVDLCRCVCASVQLVSPGHTSTGINRTCGSPNPPPPPLLCSCSPAATRRHRRCRRPWRRGRGSWKQPKSSWR